MLKAMNHIAYLSQEIGPRPAGTEEEQQAALYLADAINEGTSLSATIEDFSGSTGTDFTTVICALIALIFGVVAILVPFLAIPGIVVTVLAAALRILDKKGIETLSRMKKKAISQNVVAKYVPDGRGESAARQRKVIVVARYDSGKVRTELRGALLGMMPLLRKIGFWSAIALPVLLIAKYLLFRSTGGFFVVIITALIILSLVGVAIPLVLALLHKTANYNEAANANASGAALLLELAGRLGSKAPNAAEYVTGQWKAVKKQDGGTSEFRPAVHGEEAARESGYVPAGAELSYAAAPAASAAWDSSMQDEGIEQGSNESLLAAKAAVAALSGRPASKEIFLGSRTSADAADASRAREGAIAVPEGDVAEAPGSDAKPRFEEAAQERPAAVAEEAAFKSEPEPRFEPVPEPAPEPEPEAAKPEVPSWFLSARAKARKSDPEEETEIKRSVYADALDKADAMIAAANAANEAAEAAEAAAAAAAEAAASETAEQRVGETAIDARIREVQEEIQAVRAPVFDDEPKQAAPAADSVDGAVPEAAVEQGNTEAAASPAGSEANGEAVAGAPEIEQAESIAAIAAPSDEPEEAEAEQLPKFVLPAESLIATQAQGTAESLEDALMATGSLAPISDGAQQYAPLALAAEGNPMPKPGAGLSSLAQLAPIGATGVVPVVRQVGETVPGTVQQAPAGSLLSLPSFDAPAVAPQVPQVSAPQPLQLPTLQPDIPAPAYAGMPGSTTAFAPVSNELAQNASSEADLYVDDVDDSAFAENYTETGALAGPGYVDMPKKRGLFGRRRKNKNAKNAAVTAQEWLDVDEDFNAQDVGRERGGWESFRTDDDGYAPDEQVYDAAPNLGNTQYMDMREVPPLSPEELDWNSGASMSSVPPMQPVSQANDAWRSDNWNGGAFSLKRSKGEKRSGRRKNGRDEADFREDYPVYPSGEENGAYAPAYEDDAYERDYPHEEDRLSATAQDLGSIEDFHDVELNAEVWFVALGSELEGNAGIKAFLNDHGSELRGALFIELDSLGAGNLCTVEKEGISKRVQNSSRMKRYAKRASQVTGLSCGNVNLLYADSTSSYVSSHGYQALHLAGIQNGKQAHFAQADDVIENIDEETLFENTAFVLEVLKAI